MKRSGKPGVDHPASSALQRLNRRLGHTVQEHGNEAMRKIWAGDYVRYEKTKQDRFDAFTRTGMLSPGLLDEY